jgi:hypothetical protein
VHDIYAQIVGTLQRPAGDIPIAATLRPVIDEKPRHGRGLASPASIAPFDDVVSPSSPERDQRESINRITRLLHQSCRPMVSSEDIHNGGCDGKPRGEYRIKDFTRNLTPKSTRTGHSRRRLIVLAVCAAFALVVVGCCYAVGMVVTAIMEGLAELAVGLAAIVAALVVGLAVLLFCMLLVHMASMGALIVALVWLRYVGDVTTIFTQWLQ